MRILSKIFKFNKEEKLGFSSLSFDNVLNYIMSVVNSNKYDLGKYYTGIMMKEYLIVVKDILQVSGRIPTMKEVNININKYGNKDEKLRNYFLPYGLNMEGKKNNRCYW